MKPATLHIASSKRQSRPFFYHCIAYLLVAGIFVSGMPTRVISQDTETVLNALENVTMSAKASDKSSRMRFGTFGELNAYSASQSAEEGKIETAETGSTPYVVLSIEFKTMLARRAVFTDLKKSNIKGAYAFATVDRFADVFVETDQAMEAIGIAPGVVRIEFSRRVLAPPPPENKLAPTGSKGIADPIVRGGHAGLTGKGVTIAILDTGIDFRHPDFIKYDAQGRPSSRLKYIWDTATPFQTGRGSKSPVLYPNGGSIGTLYTQAQLTAELRAATQTIPATDLDGHGTACAGIAAGNGNADKLPTGLKRKEVDGVAPDADIIGVRFGQTGFENIFTLSAAAEWLDKLAGATPLILSGSFGGHYSGHDGQTIRERHLSARFPLARVGRSILFAAGNDGATSMHAMMQLDATPKTLRWTSRAPATLIMFFDTADALQVAAPAATPLNNLFNEVNPLTGQRQAELEIAAGQGSIQLSNPTGKATEAHFYILGRGTFVGPERVFSHLVGTPGGTETAITVGSYDWNDSFNQSMVPQLAPCLGSDGKQLVVSINSLSCYSSPGPNRTIAGKKGATKPEIVAPGQYYASPNARENGQTPNEYADVDKTGYYRLMNGTSAATPYTAGIVALMFQKKPTLTLGQVRDLLISRSSKTGLNPFTSGALPNKDWGYGKLNMAAVDAILTSIK